MYSSVVNGAGSPTRSASSSVRRGRVRFRAVMALAVLVPQLTGCYQYVPMAAQQVPAGTRVSVDVTDNGRLALTERIGPGVRRLGGSVVGSSDTALVLSVSTVDFVDVPVPVHWNGDNVPLSRAFLSEVRGRRFSKPRSFLMAGVLALTAVGVSTLALVGFGSSGDGERSGEGDSGH